MISHGTITFLIHNIKLSNKKVFENFFEFKEHFDLANDIICMGTLNLHRQEVIL